MSRAEIGRPVGQIEDGEDHGENDAGDDVDPLGAQRVAADPRGSATSAAGSPVRMQLQFAAQPPRATSGTAALFHEDDFGSHRHQRSLPQQINLFDSRQFLLEFQLN